MNNFYVLFVAESDSATISPKLGTDKKDPTEAAWLGQKVIDDKFIVKNYNKKGIFYDWIHGISWAPYVKGHVKKRLESILGDLVQWVGPFQVQGHELYLLNCINVIDCAKDESNHNRLYLISGVLEGQIIFRPKNFLMKVIVSESLKNEIESAMDTGIRFGKICEDGRMIHPFASQDATLPVWKLEKQPTTVSSVSQSTIESANNLHNSDHNVFYNKDLGVRLVKPEDWEFVPTEWALAFRQRVDPDYEELKKIMTLASLPFVVFRYNHGANDLAYPTVQLTCRTFTDESMQDHREETLKMQCEQLKKTYENVDIIDANSNMQISGFPASRIIAKFSIHTREGQEFKCLSQGYTVYVRKLGFTIAMSGPSEGPYQRRDDFMNILKSIVIE